MHSFRNESGITLIETMVYVALLSSLLACFIPYAYAINRQNLKLIDDIADAERSA